LSHDAFPIDHGLEKIVLNVLFYIANDIHDLLTVNLKKFCKYKNTVLTHITAERALHNSW